MKIILLLLGALAFNVLAAVDRPEVRLSVGTLQGVVEGNMQVFKGIPYAAPPVGDLRWRPPQAVKAWTGTRDASKFGAACPQPYVKGLNDGMAPGSEDCLNLNVFTPKAGKNLPVMVWIHGGGLLVDAAKDAQFTPISLIKNGVIVITFDYRMGTFGFFAPKELIDEAKSKGEPVGNYGTMDQIAVLKWVKNNIQAFGGDPNNVTIFGESAGGRIQKYAQGGIMSAPKFQAGGEMESDAFVIPADVVSALGNGSTDAGVRKLNDYLGVALLIEGEGDGLSDDTPATIDGEHPARVADGEVYIPADIVAQLGEGDPEEGAEMLYELIDKIRKAAHGKTTQQREVDLNEVMPE